MHEHSNVEAFLSVLEAVNRRDSPTTTSTFSRDTSKQCRVASGPSSASHRPLRVPRSCAAWVTSARGGLRAYVTCVG